MLHYTTRAGQPWSAHEDVQLRVEARNLLSIRNIAMTHLRSMGSIVARLEKLGFVVDTHSSDEDDWTYALPTTPVEGILMKI